MKLIALVFVLFIGAGEKVKNLINSPLMGKLLKFQFLHRQLYHRNTMIAKLKRIFI